MVIIPGVVISAITFPGVIVHEFAHKLFCQLTHTKVLKVCYFRVGNPAGFVVHELPTNFWKHLLIGIGPLFVNTLVGAFLGLLALPLIHKNGDMAAFFQIVVVWLSVSVAMHSFPSTGDAKSIWAAIWRSGTSIWEKMVGVPLVGVIYLGAMGSVFGLNIAYGVVAMIALQKVLRLS